MMKACKQRPRSTTQRLQRPDSAQRLLGVRHRKQLCLKSDHTRGRVQEGRARGSYSGFKGQVLLISTHSNAHTAQCTLVDVGKGAGPAPATPQPAPQPATLSCFLPWHRPRLLHSQASLAQLGLPLPLALHHLRTDYTTAQAGLDVGGAMRGEWGEPLLTPISRLCSAGPRSSQATNTPRAPSRGQEELVPNAALKSNEWLCDHTSIGVLKLSTLQEAQGGGPF